ncbi:unnamed protein product [Leuciscus chuanchicus]
MSLMYSVKELRDLMSPSLRLPAKVYKLCTALGISRPRPRYVHRGSRRNFLISSGNSDGTIPTVVSMRPAGSSPRHRSAGSVDYRNLLLLSLPARELPVTRPVTVLPRGGVDSAYALASWKLVEDRQVCVTTDSGTNMIKAMKLNDWTHLQCFGHRLHNAIEHGVKDHRVDRAVAVCKKVVSVFSFSWKKRRDLASAQAELGLPSHQLITETPTGFRTTYIEHDKLEGIKQKVVKELTSLLPDKNLETTVQMTQDVEQEEQRTEAGAKRKKTLASFFKKTAPASQPVIQSEEDKVKAELTAYLMSPDTGSTFHFIGKKEDVMFKTSSVTHNSTSKEHVPRRSLFQ